MTKFHKISCITEPSLSASQNFRFVGLREFELLS